MTYQWTCPHHWLNEHIMEEQDRVKLLNIIRLLAGRHDCDTIQDIFEADMDADNYFGQHEEDEE